MNLKYLAIFGCFLGTFWGYFYYPVSHSEAQPWLLRSYIFLMRFPSDLGSVLEYFGILNRLSVERFQYNVVESLVFRNESFTVDTSEEWIDGVRVLVFSPKTANSLSSTNDQPAIVFIHGGGWTLLRPEFYAAITNTIATKLGIKIFSIDYRLAPEHSYPAGLFDCERVVMQLLNAKSEHVHRHKLDVSRIAIVGDSAGGNLAAVLVQRLARNSPVSNMQFKIQALIYPITQVILFNTTSYLLNANDGMLSRSKMLRHTVHYAKGQINATQLKYLTEIGHAHLVHSDVVRLALTSTAPLRHTRFSGMLEALGLPDEVEAEHLEAARDVAMLRHDVNLSPLLADDIFDLVPRLPPLAYLATCERDVLRDDGVSYRELLEAAAAAAASASTSSKRMRVHHNHYDAVHGALNMAASFPGPLGDRFQYAPGRQMIDELSYFLQRHL